MDSLKDYLIEKGLLGKAEQDLATSTRLFKNIDPT